MRKTPKEIFIMELKIRNLQKRLAENTRIINELRQETDRLNKGVKQMSLFEILWKKYVE